MGNLDAVWDAIRKLTYAEAIDFAGTLRDTTDDLGLSQENVESWASIIDAARQAYEARDEA